MKKAKLSKSRVLSRSFLQISYGLSSLILIGASILLIMISMTRPDFASNVRTYLADLTAPVIETVTKPITYTAHHVRTISGLAALQQDNARLSKENALLREWYLRAQSLQTENAELRNILNVKHPTDVNLVTAEILTDTSSPFVKSVMVKAGKQDGVSKNDVVMSPRGVVGRILEVGETTARVLLITDMNSRLPVVVVDHKNNETVHAVLSGQNNHDIHINHMAKSHEMLEGDHVMTSGLGGVYPRGLAVGVVKNNDDEEQVVQPYMDPSRMSFLKILTQSPNVLVPSNNVVEPELEKPQASSPSETKTLSLNN